MKTQKSILMVILLGLVFTLSSYASEGKAAHEAEYELKHHISFLFKAVPWEDLVEPHESCTVVISFKVNNESQLEDIQVEGENEDLVHYTKIVLNRNKISADQVLKGKTYKMQIKFENKG